MRGATIQTQPCSTSLSSAALQGPRVEPATQTHRSRRGHGARHGRALHRHQSLRPRQNALREGVLRTWGGGEPDQGHEALYAIRQDRLLALAGQPVPTLLARGRLLAAAFSAAGGTQALTLARRYLRNHPSHLCENRCARRGAEGQDQARLPSQLSSDRNARRHNWRHYHAWPMRGPAGPAKPLPSTANAFPSVDEPTPVNPADPRCLLSVRFNPANKRG